MTGRSVQPDASEIRSGSAATSARLRSDGPLDANDLAAFRARGAALAYDPVQIGWVPADCVDDLSPDGVMRPWPEAGSARQGAPRIGRDLTAVASRYAFRPWREADAPAFVALLDNPKIWELLPEDYPDPLTEDLARDLIALSNQGEHHVVRAIETGGALVGQVRLLFNPAADDRSEGEISYWLGEPHWGRGIGADAVALFTEHCFRELNALKTIFGRVHERNAASARILEKSGYVRDSSNPYGAPWIVYRISRGGV